MQSLPSHLLVTVLQLSPSYVRLFHPVSPLHQEGKDKVRTLQHEQWDGQTNLRDILRG